MCGSDLAKRMECGCTVGHAFLSFSFVLRPVSNSGADGWKLHFVQLRYAPSILNIKLTQLPHCIEHDDMC